MNTGRGYAEAGFRNHSTGGTFRHGIQNGFGEWAGLMERERATNTLPVVEENLHVEKREVSRGKVRVHTVADTVEELVRETLEEQQVEVTRTPIDEVVTTRPSVRTEDGVVIVQSLRKSSLSKSALS